MLLNKNASVNIVIPDNPLKTEIFAADELKKYLGMIFGMCPEVIPDTTKAHGNIFLIGAPQRNKLAAQYISVSEFQKVVPGPEGVFIKQFNDNVILLAGSFSDIDSFKRGTIYSVYEFLERYLGCNFAAFGYSDKNIGEFVPEYAKKELDNSIFYVKEKSDRPYRTAIVQYSNWAGNPDRKLNLPFFDWLVKNRYNRILTWSSIYEFYKKSGLLDEAEKRGISFTVGHHESSKLFLPDFGNEYFSEKYYETHPEYYKLMEDGTRFSFKDHAGQWVFCSRNEDAAAEVAKNVLYWLKLNPAVDTVAFWPNDGMSSQCMCSECQKYTKVENYTYFINKVAGIVKKERPDIKFDMLVYVDLWECPQDIILEDNIIIDESTWHKDGLRLFGKKDGSCLNGTHFEDNILKWKNAGANVVYYDYYMGVYGLRQRLIPMADEVQSIWKNFAQKGILGAGTQIECYNIWNHIFNFYTFGRCAYDSSLSFSDNINRFISLFGKGGKYIKEIIEMQEECIDGNTKMHDCGHYIMENIDKEKIYTLYNEALSKAEKLIFRNNIRMMRMEFRYTDIETNEKLSKREEFNIVEKEYDDITGELAKMSEFDSFWKNDPGYGIMIPVDSKKVYSKKDIWYEFELTERI